MVDFRGKNSVRADFFDFFYEFAGRKSTIYKGMYKVHFFGKEKIMKFCVLVSASGVFFSVLLLVLHAVGIHSDSVAWVFLPYLASLVLLAVLLPRQVNKYQDTLKSGNEEET